MPVFQSLLWSILAHALVQNIYSMYVLVCVCVVCMCGYWVSAQLYKSTYSSWVIQFFTFLHEYFESFCQKLEPPVRLEEWENGSNHFPLRPLCLLWASHPIFSYTCATPLFPRHWLHNGSGPRMQAALHSRKDPGWEYGVKNKTWLLKN